MFNKRGVKNFSKFTEEHMYQSSQLEAGRCFKDCPFICENLAPFVNSAVFIAIFVICLSDKSSREPLREFFYFQGESIYGTATERYSRNESLRQKLV